MNSGAPVLDCIVIMLGDLNRRIKLRKAWRERYKDNAFRKVPADCAPMAYVRILAALYIHAAD